MFEDVGVTAYNGGAPLIQDKTYLAAAASILAVEAYHAANIRTAILAIGRAGNSGILDTAKKISDARDAVNSSVDKDQPITTNGASNGPGNIVPADEFGLAFSRTTSEVLNIVYLNPNKTPGAFFPRGLNGSIA